MGDGRIFLKNLRETSFSNDLIYRMSLLSAESISLDSTFNSLHTVAQCSIQIQIDNLKTVK